jgi:hypothetical protein
MDANVQGNKKPARQLEFPDPKVNAIREKPACPNHASHSWRVTFIQADLMNGDWRAKVTLPVEAIVSTWALHDLGGEVNTRKVYRDSRNLLSPGGVLLNGDFVKPEYTAHEYEPGRFLVSRHLDILEEMGFNDVRCLIYLERDIDNPTAAQNYACLQAIV